jgi:predicted Zn-dependent protease
MKQLNQEEAKRIAGASCRSRRPTNAAYRSAAARGNVRFARNSVSTAGLNEDTQLTVSVAFGKRQGTATVNEFDDKSLEKAVRRAEEWRAWRRRIRNSCRPSASRTSRPSADLRAPPPPSIRSTAPKSLSTASTRAQERAGGGRLLQRHHGLRVHRQFERRVRLPGTHRPEFHLHRAHRRRPRLGLGDRSAYDAPLRRARSGRRGDREGAALGRREGAGAGPLYRDPGAGGDVRPAGNYMFSAFDARAADEGRSFLAKKGGGNRLGDKLFDEQVNVWADPWDPDVPVLPWDGNPCRRASART